MNCPYTRQTSSACQKVYFLHLFIQKIDEQIVSVYFLIYFSY